MASFGRGLKGQKVKGENCNHESYECETNRTNEDKSGKAFATEITEKTEEKEKRLSPETLRSLW